jgi:hypothetical protein
MNESEGVRQPPSRRDNVFDAAEYELSEAEAAEALDGSEEELGVSPEALYGFRADEGQTPNIGWETVAGAPAVAAPSAAARQDAVKIGLWGSPASGKTTFLGALRHAVGNETDCGKWGIFPANKRSSELLIDLTNELTGGRFPEATTPGGRYPLQWVFAGDLAGSRFAPRRRWRKRADPLLSKFTLDLIDVSGKAFGYDPSNEKVDPTVAGEALEHLAASEGLIYLFDPLRERTAGDATDYVNRTVGELRLRYADASSGPYMPQHVAVCVTKFDNKDVFHAARRHGLVKLGDDGMPRVPDDRAEEFFDLMCTGQFWGDKHEQGDRSAYFVRNELRNAFGDTVEYFVTSSIGFKRQPGWSGSISDFDPEDSSNYRTVGGNQPGILGAIRPINILEPLIRLQQRLEQQRATQRAPRRG